MRRFDITIAICTHDNAEMLDRALVKLARQRVSPGILWELLVVDNRSGDRTPALLAEWQARAAFPELQVVREERLGLSNARRAAIRAARSELIAFVDDDCLLHQGWVEGAVAFARQTPRAGAFGGHVEIKWEPRRPALGKACEWALARQERGSRPLRLPPRGGVPLVGAGLVVRRSALEESGWIERGALPGRVGKALTAGDDAEIGFRIRAAGWELWYAPALRLQHVMPSWRGEYPYLARLYRGTGRTLPHIWLLAGTFPRVPFVAVFFALLGLARAARKALSGRYHLARGETAHGARRLLEAHLYYGCFLGALELPATERARAPAARVALPDQRQLVRGV